MKHGLGRGLGTLLSSASLHVAVAPVDSKLSQLAIETIQPGKYQPRQEMTKESLEELADSIRAQGIIQPIVVRSVGPQRYEIIAGERRWRAAQLAGLHKVPVLIREVPDDAAMAMALIENIQRENLNAIEEATALKRLLEEFTMTQQEIAEAIGKSRVTVTNLMRLLELHPDAKSLLQQGLIDRGHAKVLLGLPHEEQGKAAKIIVSKNLSVRETEHLIKNWQTVKPAKIKRIADPDIIKLEQRLSDRLGTQVNVEHSAKGKGRGKLVIHYQNLDILDGLLERLEQA